MSVAQTTKPEKKFFASLRRVRIAEMCIYRVITLASSALEFITIENPDTTTTIFD